MPHMSQSPFRTYTDIPTHYFSQFKSILLLFPVDNALHPSPQKCKSASAHITTHSPISSELTLQFLSDIRHCPQQRYAHIHAQTSGGISRRCGTTTAYIGSSVEYSNSQLQLVELRDKLKSESVARRPSCDTRL
jgi:hypothetical protein